MESILSFSHQLLKTHIIEGDTVVDATVGNGNDTLVLAQLVGPSGRVHGFDIQEQAIQNTQEKLLLTGQLDQVQLHLRGHEKVNQVLEPNQRIGGAIFNLGYLPKGDKTIITKSTTTLQALSSLLDHLRIGGILVLVLYYGHEGGLEESQAVEEYVTKLDQKNFSVLKYQFVNQVNQPPYLLAIERKKSN